jgi:hypothetical protein
MTTTTPRTAEAISLAAMRRKFNEQAAGIFQKWGCKTENEFAKLRAEIAKTERLSSGYTGQQFTKSEMLDHKQARAEARRRYLQISLDDNELDLLVIELRREAEILSNEKSARP